MNWQTSLRWMCMLPVVALCAVAAAHPFIPVLSKPVPATVYLVTTTSLLAGGIYRDRDALGPRYRVACVAVAVLATLAAVVGIWGSAAMNVDVVRQSSLAPIEMASACL